jgi:hypothetical protein
LVLLFRSHLRQAVAVAVLEITPLKQVKLAALAAAELVGPTK